MLLEELLTSFFSYDGRFFRTLAAFLFNPGVLTRSFNSGQRKKYTHPIRLYLIFSLFYFFIIGFLIPKDMVDRLLNFQEVSVIGDEQPETQDQIPESTKEKIEHAISLEMLSDSPDGANSGSDSTPKKLSWKELRFLSIDPAVNDEQFSRTLKNSQYAFDLGLSSEKRRAFIAHSNLFLSQAVKNLPLMMLILLPVFALIVHLLYSKRQHFYIENLILGFHLHAFAYAVYGLVILLSLVFRIQNNWLAQIAFVLVTTYAYLSILRLFNQHWFRTLIKFWVLGFCYLLVLIGGFVLELYLSLILL